MSFDAPQPDSVSKKLTAAERAFVEKYLGLDVFDAMPAQDPRAQLAADPQPQLQKQTAKPQSRLQIAAPVITIASPEIHVAKAKPSSIVVGKTASVIETSPSEPVAVESGPAIVNPAPAAIQTPILETVMTQAAEKLAAPEKIATGVPEKIRSEATGQTAVKDIANAEIEVSAVEKVEAPVILPAAELEKNIAAVAGAVEAVSQARTASPELLSAPTMETVLAAERTETAEIAPHTAEQALAGQQKAPESLATRDILRQEEEIQMVSFYVGGQLFLLPVGAIQEVLRHMELVKVPQAPDFVAGAINLRGRVMPLVYLSALLTTTEPSYTEKNFIIVCGSENLQLGLIIDRITGMHMLPQNRIIWNVESKVGDRGDFLHALANLDDRVCGIVAPEMITQKILSSQG